MVLDSSVIIAIQLREPGSKALLEKILAANVVLIGAPTVLESILVTSSKIRNDDPRIIVQGFLRTIGADILDFTPAHLEASAAAFMRFGKGRHPAGLNFGDCISYAYSAISGYPLLYKDEDFAKTDVKSA